MVDTSGCQLADEEDPGSRRWHEHQLGALVLFVRPHTGLQGGSEVRQEPREPGAVGHVD